MSTTADIGNLILGKAAKVPGETWTKIQQAAKLYVNGYSQNLLDIAQGVVDGDLTPDEGGPFEAVAAFSELTDPQDQRRRFDYGLDELARRFDRSVSWVSRRLALVATFLFR